MKTKLATILFASFFLISLVSFAQKPAIEKTNKYHQFFDFSIKQELHQFRAR